MSTEETAIELNTARARLLGVIAGEETQAHLFEVLELLARVLGDRILNDQFTLLAGAVRENREHHVGAWLAYEQALRADLAREFRALRAHDLQQDRRLAVLDAVALGTPLPPEMTQPTPEGQS